MSERVRLIVEQNRDSIIDRYNNGEGIPIIASDLSVSQPIVRNVIKDSGIRMRRVLHIESIDGIDHKICTKCGILKPIEEYNRRCGTRASMCRDCAHLYGRLYRARQVTLHDSDNVIEKVCSKCGQIKPIEEYEWKQKGIRRRSYCKSCGKIRYKSYHESNKDRINTYSRNYYRIHSKEYNEYQRRRNAAIRQKELVIDSIRSATDIMSSHIPMISPNDVVGYKECSRCRDIKSIDEYSKNTSQCKKCDSIIGREWRDAHPDIVRLHHEKYRDLRSEWKRNDRRKMLSHVYTYLEDHPCTECSEDDIRCLSFHHISNDKTEGISRMVSSHYTWEEILSEMEKCIVLCQNCHMIVHYIPSDMSRYTKNRLRNITYRDEYLAAHPCVDCGESRIQVLHFHHIRGQKIRNVSKMITGSLDILKSEIDKCEVVCANCHRRRHPGKYYSELYPPPP